MKLQTSHQNTVATIGIVGQFWEKADILQLYEEVDKCMTQNIRLIILDLERLTFLGSMGLGAIAKVFTNLRDNNCALVLYKPTEGVKESIEISGFTSIMSLVESREELDTYLIGMPQ
jgi:anti-anti-sigma factor